MNSLLPTTSRTRGRIAHWAALGLWWVGCLAIGAAETIPLEKRWSANADFEAFQAEAAKVMPANLPSALSSVRWSEYKRIRLNLLGWQFIADYPADPRRWDVALELLRQTPVVIKSYDETALAEMKPKSLKAGAIVFDEEATARMRERLASLEAQCAAATDMRSVTRRNFRFFTVNRRLAEFRKTIAKSRLINGPTGEMPQPGGAGNPLELQPSIEELIADYPEDPETVKVFSVFVSLVRRYAPADARALLQASVNSPSPGVAAAAPTALTSISLQ
jgi:hypothetical protein